MSEHPITIDYIWQNWLGGTVLLHLIHSQLTGSTTVLPERPLLFSKAKLHMRRVREAQRAAKQAEEIFSLLS